MPRCSRPTMGLAVMLLTLLAGAATAGRGNAQPGDDSVALAEVMLTRLNEARRDSGLEPYRVNPILTDIAFAHAREIAAHTHYSHTGLDGRKPKDRARDAGYGAGREGVRIGENFVGRQHLDDGFQWLMDDPPHRANMLDPNYREVGVGAARISYGYIWVLDFGTYAGIDQALAAPPTARPAPTEPPTATPEPTATQTTAPTEAPAPTATETLPPTGPATADATAPGGAGTTPEPGASAYPAGTSDAPGGAATSPPSDAADDAGAGSSRPAWLWLLLLAVAVATVAAWAWSRRG